MIEVGEGHSSQADEEDTIGIARNFP